MAPPELILADTLEELLFKGVKVGRQRAAYQALFFTVLVSYAGYELVSRDGQDVVATLFWGAGMVIAIWRLLAVLRYAWQLRRNKVERLLELGGEEPHRVASVRCISGLRGVHVRMDFDTGEWFVIQLPAVDVELLLEQWRTIRPDLPVDGESA